MDIITGYLLTVNIISFVLYGMDKYKAKRGKWRISEATLLTMAVIGGSIGAWTGMKVWHHKTMHKKFTIGVPLVLTLQAALAIYLHIRA
ncbi:MAG: DUF1294 domain-containing protein [Prevotellaceae bacterium]|nr:DUF1294 domain-containing protein [Prevotellaceae bacterium]MDO4932033.1 DUF1294 domain-containing protein [Prevotellaceae bacterium]